MVLIRHEKCVKGQYFVKLNGYADMEGTRNRKPDWDLESFERQARQIASDYGAKLLYIYYPVLLAFAVSELDVGEAERLSSEDDRVEGVEEDTPVIPPAERRVSLARRLFLHLRKLFFPTTSWALDRIDQESPQLNGRFEPPATGMGVRVYVLDSGVSNPYKIFGKRLVDPGISFFPPGTEDTDDLNNHGTSVAAVIGGPETGVAPGVQIFPVRVWGNGDGSACSIAAGVTWVAQQVQKDKIPSVANISLEVPFSECLNDAVEAAQEYVQFVVAAGKGPAGKGPQDVKDSSPASAPSAVTVAGSLLDEQDEPIDRMAGDSNYGKGVDIFAPGRYVDTVSVNGVRGEESGTSYSAALTTGALALYLERFPNASPPTLRQKLIDAASQGKIDDPKGSPNYLLRIF